MYINHACEQVIAGSGTGEGRPGRAKWNGHTYLAKAPLPWSAADIGDDEVHVQAMQTARRLCKCKKFVRATVPSAADFSGSRCVSATHPGRVELLGSSPLPSLVSIDHTHGQCCPVFRHGEPALGHENRHPATCQHYRDMAALPSIAFVSPLLLGGSQGTLHSIGRGQGGRNIPDALSTLRACCECLARSLSLSLSLLSLDKQSPCGHPTSRISVTTLPFLSRPTDIVPAAACVCPALFRKTCAVEESCAEPVSLAPGRTTISPPSHLPPSLSPGADPTSHNNIPLPPHRYTPCYHGLPNTKSR